MSAVNENAPATDPVDPPAVRAARSVVDLLLAHGMRDAVVCPGSRSAPLAYALADAEAEGRVRLHVRVDERTAGFLALGLCRGAGLDGPPVPVAVVTTSGTAAANLHPAILEAHHAGVPVVALTADRPHELRGTGANQTTDQVGLFGTAVRHAVDVPAPEGRDGQDRDLRDVVTRAVVAATGARTAYPGPVHLNLAFRDPLAPSRLRAAGEGSGSGTDVPVVGRVEPVLAPDVLAHPLLDAGPDEPPTVLVAGDGAGPHARRLAEARGWPVLAEASSGASGGSNGIAAHRLVLGVEGLVSTVRRVVVAGRPTLSRPVQALLGRKDVDVVVLAPGGAPWPDAARSAALVLPAVPARWWEAEPGPAGHLDQWRRAGTAAAVAVARVLDDDEALTGVHVARAVARATGAGGLLVVGSSNPVRDLDLVLDATPPLVLANRGLAGIDGTVSTATGVAVAAGRPTTLLAGDLTFLHDAGGLLRGPGEPPLDLRIVVVDDDGGSIFATLEHGRLATEGDRAAARFERIFGTPHGADLGTIAAGYGVAVVEIDGRAGTGPDALDALGSALARPVHGMQMIHVRVGRDGRRTHGQALAAAVVRACSYVRS
ncbi:2-succinyl-5-enolpyruvyl-6-hydroxy-3-cyclohexene-1-carboxylate synthase [Paraoerskovia marina]|uniref:2-succinyl-5-enolpyruvyl-6-hydroxy-3-cyclohexene-1-carboxylate synthase n=1 Tax=Paraoerskovia marina TaxID=545619 RepID=A0A1H1VIW6_9CELL|nr:2-succinyl-5-enolpyruvyl-6-hydroxy-3-cyclohexene-1-carboxylate synthase [Paraoerskovia marina]